MTSLPPHEGLAGVVLGKHLLVKAAADYSGCNEQYLWRLHQSGRLEGTKVGQVWLTKLAALEQHLQQGWTGQDWRRCPQGTAAEQRPHLARPGALHYNPVDADRELAC